MLPKSTTATNNNSTADVSVESMKLMAKKVMLAAKEDALDARQAAIEERERELGLMHPAEFGQTTTRPLDI